MINHFVTFYSPGTVFAETRTLPIDSWDVPAAVALAGSVHERYNARPYGFAFITRERGEGDLDSRITARSPMHYLGGTIETLADVEARHEIEGGLEILISNMRNNDLARVITFANPWRSTHPVQDDAIVLEWPASGNQNGPPTPQDRDDEVCDPAHPPARA